MKIIIFTENTFIMRRIVAALAVLTLGCSVFGQQRYGIVKYSANFMRSEPDYESGLETQALMGTPVLIHGSSRYWLDISTPDYRAWANAMGVVQMDSLEIRDYIAAPKYICTSLWAEVFTSPHKSSPRMSDLVAGDLLRMRVNADGKPAGNKAFAAVILPDGREGYVRTSDAACFRVWAESRKAVAENVTASAMRFLGTPYMWGGYSSKGLDCSGLVKTAFFLNGVVLRRNASQQAKEGVDVSPEGFVPGKSEGALKPGDLLFFGKKATPDSRERITHVAIYIGNGRIIHSSQEVRINSLDPEAEDYYSGAVNLVRIRRICDEAGNPYTSARVISSPEYFPQKN